jgi:hypothetical protein
MPEESVIDRHVGVLTPATGKQSSSLDDELLAKQFADGLGEIGPAIALAGAAYPVLLAAAYSIAMLVYLLSSRTAVSGLGESFILALMFSFLGAGIGLIWTTIVAFAVLPLVYLFVRSMELRGSTVRLGAFCGGLVGFVAVLPFFFGVMSSGPSTLSEIVFLALVGPALATIVGQVGGAWGGWRTGWYERALIQAVSREGGIADELPADGSENAESTQPHRIQFGIRHLLVISIWISLLLTAIRLSGLDFLSMLSLLGAWVVCQAVTSRAVGPLMVRFLTWRGRRKSRST